MAARTRGARERVKSHKNKTQTRDLFMDMPYDDAIKRTTTTPSPPSPSEQHQRHSLFTDPTVVQLVLTPLHVVSFILSLLFMAERHYGRQSNKSDPKQEVTGSAWHPRWSWRKRKNAKMRIDEALEMKNRIVLSIVVWAVLGLVAGVYGARSLYSWFGASGPVQRVLPF